MGLVICMHNIICHLQGRMGVPSLLHCYFGGRGQKSLETSGLGLVGLCCQLTKTWAFVCTCSGLMHIRMHTYTCVRVHCCPICRHLRASTCSNVDATPWLFLSVRPLSNHSIWHCWCVSFTEHHRTKCKCSFLPYFPWMQKVVWGISAGN